MQRSSRPTGILLFLALAGAASANANADAPRPVTVSVDATRSVGPLSPVWRLFGADEPNYATMKDGRKLLAELGRLKHGEVYFRAHLWRPGFDYKLIALGN